MVCTTAWASEPPDFLSAQEIHWLFAPGSLTRKLRALGDFGIQLLDQREDPAGAADAASLGVPEGSAIWVREVLMSIAGQPAVLARSIASLTALEGGWSSLADYGRQPLGDMLYNDPAIARSPFECSAPQNDDPLGELAQRLGAGHTGLRARRSRFMRGGATLLVSECFLPGFWEMARASVQAH